MVRRQVDEVVVTSMSCEDVSIWGNTDILRIRVEIGDMILDCKQSRTDY